MKTFEISPVIGHFEADRSVSFLRRRRRWSTALLVSAIAGILTGGTGLILAGAALFRFISPYSGLGVAGTVLLVVTFPLLVLNAHCLDRIEDIKREQRMANYKRLVLDDPKMVGSDHGLQK